MKFAVALGNDGDSPDVALCERCGATLRVTRSGAEVVAVRELAEHELSPLDRELLDNTRDMLAARLAGKSQRIAVLHCLTCGHRIDEAVGPGGGPIAGACCLCVYCGGLAMFASPSKLRPCTPAELAILEAVPAVVEMRAALAEMLPLRSRGLVPS